MKSGTLLLLNILLLLNLSGLYAQKDSVFWNRDMIKIATLKSNADWINIKPEVIIEPSTFLSAYKKALNLGVNDSMRLYKTEQDRAGFTHYKYQQYYKGYKIIFGEFLLHSRQGKLVSANGKMIRGLSKKVTISLTKEAALQNALQVLPAIKYAWEIPALEKNYQQITHDPHATYRPVGELVWISTDEPDEESDVSKYELTYMFDIYPASLDGSRIFISAANGRLVRSYPLVANCSGTSVTTNFNGSQIFSTKHVILTDPPYYNLWNDCRSAFIRTQDWATATDYTSGVNNNWSGFASAASTHWAVERAYDYFLTVHKRDGWNAAGNGITVYQDALFCTGTGCMPSNPNNASFGNGIMKIGNSGTTNTLDDWNSVDIISHEFTHGVTSSTAGLIYSKESGALNESFSDIFGASSYNWFSNGNNANIWLAGFDRTNSAGNNLYLRNMSNPNDAGASTPSPDTYLSPTFWISTTTPTDVSNDNWGVHTNSGVQNFMYYLLAKGGSGVNDNGDAYAVIALGIEKAQAIAYEALTFYLTSSSQYADARNAWVHAAVNLYGSCSFEAIETGKAWYAVGLNPPSIDQRVCGEVTGVFSGNASGTYNLSLNCNLTIINGALASYGAPKTVISPGFWAQPGSYFNAYSSDCRFAEY